MSKPSRPSNPDHASGQPRTFFVTTETAGRRRLFQTERMALLLIDVLRANMKEGKFTVHDFVVMPDHVHILMTVPGDQTVERAMQSIKGGFSFRAKTELGFTGDIWQRGFSDVRVIGQQSFQQHQEYIDLNPIKAGLVGSADEYPYASRYLKRQKAAGAKAPQVLGALRHD